MSERRFKVNIGVRCFFSAVLISISTQAITMEKLLTGETKVLYEKRFDKEIEQVWIVS